MSAKGKERRQRARALRTRQHEVPDEDVLRVGQRRLTALQNSAGQAESLQRAQDRARAFGDRVDGSDDADSFVAALADWAREFSGPRPDGLPLQDSASHEMLTGVVRRVQAACGRLSVAPLKTVVIGTIDAMDPNAFAETLFESTALIGVHGASLVFNTLFATAIVPTIFTPTDGGLRLERPEFGPPVRDAYARLAALAHALVVDENLRAAPPYLPPRSWPYWPAVAGSLDALLFFIVAHEYAHLMVAHKRIVLPASVSTGHPSEFVEELAADAFALHVAFLDTSRRAARWELRLLMPSLFFAFFGLLERDGYRRSPAEHPPSAQRLVQLVEVFTVTAPALGVHDTAVPHARRAIDECVAAMADAWKIARAVLPAVSTKS